MKQDRIPLRNYKKIRDELWAIVKQCDRKMASKAKGRMNPKTLRDKVARIHRMIEKGSYPKRTASTTKA